MPTYRLSRGNGRGHDLGEYHEYEIIHSQNKIHKVARDPSGVFRGDDDAAVLLSPVLGRW